MATKQSVLANLDKLPKRYDPDVERDGTVLSEMQSRFVVHVAEDLMNYSAAARAAGYKGDGRNASQQLLIMPKIQRAIADRREHYAKASRVTKKKVVDGFLEAIELAKLKGEPLTMVAGWREVGRMCGHYEPTRTKVEISVNGKVQIEKLNALSDDELLKLAEGEIIDNETGQFVEDGNSQ